MMTKAAGLEGSHILATDLAARLSQRPAELSSKKRAAMPLS